MTRLASPTEWPGLQPGSGKKKERGRPKAAPLFIMQKTRD
jgi:hypothetical protein